ncbi:MAG: group III truncated hemoglobin [Flavobacteriaceae bacterium]|nr:group III truncated hemoglobin [Flavobacteriaceae bacterium]
MRDIQNRLDLFQIMGSLYKKLLQDEHIKPFFKKFEDPEILEEHLQVLVNFWDNNLFYTGTYSKNAMQPHLDLHKKSPIKQAHFRRWLKHFYEAVDENFSGENAHTIKTRALSIATVMKIKIAEADKTNSKSN